MKVNNTKTGLTHITSYKPTVKWPSTPASFNDCCDRKYYNHSTTNVQLKGRYLNCFVLQMWCLFLCTNQHTYQHKPIMYTRAVNHTQLLLFHLQNVLASLSHYQGVSQIEQWEEPKFPYSNMWTYWTPPRNLNINCNHDGTAFVTYSFPWITECNMMPTTFNTYDLW